MITLSATNTLGWIVILAGIVIVSVIGASLRERDLNNKHNGHTGAAI